MRINSEVDDKEKLTKDRQLPCFDTKSSFEMWNVGE